MLLWRFGSLLRSNVDAVLPYNGNQQQGTLELESYILL